MKMQRAPRRGAIRRRLAVWVTALATVAGVSLLAASPAMADPPPPCYGSSCVGRDAAISNSSGNCLASGVQVSGTVKSPDGPFTAVLMYSPWCHSNWAVLTGGYAPDAVYFVQSYDRVLEWGGTRTAMVDGTQLARVCVYDGLGW